MLTSLIDLLISISTSLAGTLILLTIIYLIFWKLFGKKLSSKRIQLVNRVGWHQISFEVKNTIISLAAAGLFTGLILYLSNQGYTTLYHEFSKHGWAYEVFTVIVLLLWSDTTFYWIHRWLHTPRLYKYIHAVHHESLDTSPYTSNSFHFLEPVLLTMALAPAFFLFPISVGALGIIQVIGTFNNIKSHLGYELYPAWFRRYWLSNNLVTSTHHNLHHTQYNGNYALMIRFWDKVCRTELTDTDTVFDEIHQRREVIVKDNTKYRKLKISRIDYETSDTTSVYFEPDDQDFYRYVAGQYVNVRVQVDGTVHMRSFSLSSSPAEDRFLRITVKRKGAVTHWFAQKATIGDEIEALLPVGDFRVHPSDVANNQYLFVAGGSGITPLFAMIKTLLHQEQSSQIMLLYANKSVDSIIFDDELKSLQLVFPNRLAIIHFISGQNRLGEDDIAAAVKNRPNLSCYVCGPVTLKDNVKTYLYKSRVANNTVYTEEFADGYVGMLGFLDKHKSN